MIHVVGPIWHGGTHREAELLASCDRRALEIAAANDLARIALPAISCGACGYPLAHATAIAVGEVAASTGIDGTIREVIFACFGPEALACYRSELAKRGFA